MHSTNSSGECWLYYNLFATRGPTCINKQLKSYSECSGSFLSLKLHRDIKIYSIIQFHSYKRQLKKPRVKNDNAEIGNTGKMHFSTVRYLMFWNKLQWPITSPLDWPQVWYRNCTMSHICFLDIAHDKNTVMINYQLAQIQKWINPKFIYRKLIQIVVNFLCYIRKLYPNSVHNMWC